MFLEELGLINIGGLGLTAQFSSIVSDRYLRVLLTSENAIVIKHQDAAKILGLNNYRVTPLGVQVFGLNPVTTDEAYLNAVAEACAGQGFTVTTGRYRNIGNGQIHVLNEVPVNAPKINFNQ
jgi:hypothetical protein